MRLLVRDGLGKADLLIRGLTAGLPRPYSALSLSFGRPKLGLTWSVALPLCWAAITLFVLLARSMGVPVPPPLASVLAFGGVLLCPGLLLSHLILRRGELDLVEHLAVAFALSLGLTSPIAFALMAIHSTLAAFGLVFVALFVGLGIVSLIRRQPESNENGPSLTILDRLLLLVLLGLLVVVFYLSGVGKVDGDVLAGVAWMRDIFEAPRLVTEDALFGPSVPVNPRAAFNAWMLLPVFIAKVANLDLLSFFGGNLSLSSYLAVLTCLALYGLMKELSGSRTFALFASNFYVIYFLMNLYERHGNSPWMLFQRMTADKFMLMSLVLPVALIFTIRYMKRGERHNLALTFITGLAIALIHPIDYVFLAMSVGSFVFLHFIMERRRAVFLRALPLAGVVLSLATVPLILAVMALQSRSDYLLPPSFESLPLVARAPTLVLPFVSVDALQIPDPEPTVPTLPDAADPFTVVRLGAQMERQNIVVFADNRYMAHPGLLMEIGTLLALVLTPLLIFRL
ncbi:MAG: hypothetical protein M1358_13855, partial [Chloroflexi bacterium]|nr:hypothetical protein [Chloroflexota bacterium]